MGDGQRKRSLAKKGVAPTGRAKGVKNAIVTFGGKARTFADGRTKADRKKLWRRSEEW